MNPILKEDLERIHRDLKPGNKFSGATVVMTGCAGFLGFYIVSYLTEYASDLKLNKLICLDSFLLGKPNWLERLAQAYPDLIELHTFDVSKDKISTVPGADRAHYVIHAASIASPSFYRIYPVETMDANIWGLRGLLDAYREQPALKGLLFFSSSEIYGDPAPAAIPTDEEYRGNVSCHGPRACYDESKRFGETMCWVYAKQYNMPITVARPFNNYGPGLHIDDKRLPADFAKCILHGKDIVILSDGKPTRTFCYISDAVTGYLLCLLHGRYDYFNIGNPRPEISVLDVAQIYQAAGAELFGYKGKVQYQLSDDPDYMTDNPNRRCPVITKAETILGYDPKVAVHDGVHRYLEFLKYEGQA